MDDLGAELAERRTMTSLYLPTPAVTRPGAQPPPEHQDARPPEREPQSLSVLAGADLSGLPAVAPSAVGRLAVVDDVRADGRNPSQGASNLAGNPAKRTPRLGRAGAILPPAPDAAGGRLALPPPPPLLAPLKTEYAWTAKPFVAHPVPRNAQVVTLVDEPTRAGGNTRGTGPAGGSPGGWRFLCPACRAVYEALGLVGDPRTHVNAFTDGYAARTGVGLETGLNRFVQFKDAAAVAA